MSLSTGEDKNAEGEAPKGDAKDNTKRPPRWFLGLAGFMGSALALVANIGGARDFVCSFDPIKAQCERIGLGPKDEAQGTTLPAVVITTQDPSREATINSIVGTWGRKDSGCNPTVTYSVSKDARGDFHIRADMSNGARESDVTGVDPAKGIIYAQESHPNGDGKRPKWEFRLNAGEISLRDEDGGETILGTCAS